MKYDGPRLTTLATGSVALGADVPTRLRMDCVGGRQDTMIRVFAGDREVVHAADFDGHGAGSTGLVLASGDAPTSEAFFDDFVILAPAAGER